MKLTDSEIRFYVDTMIVETILGNTDLSKTAQDTGLIQSLIAKTKEYFSNHIDPDDKTGSVLNLLAPGAISVAFSAMGLGWLGMLFGFAMRIFNIDVKEILTSVYNSIKSALGSGKQLTSPQVQSMVDQAVQPYATSADGEPVTSDFNQELQNAKWLKVGLIAYEAQLNKSAGPFGFSSKKWSRSGTTSILARVLGWIFKIALASAGLLVAGDVVNKFLGRPNALDNTIQNGHPVPMDNHPVSMSKQTKFKVNPGYSDTTVSGNWVEKVPNTKSGIENLLISFVHQVYDGVNDGDIRSSGAFNKIVDDIAWYNHTSVGDQVVFIPKNFSSKKNLVDHFIDEVASKAS
jgi:hypothetical protein